MNIFKRILKIGQAEIHALVDKMESPISLIEQGIRDMKKQLVEAKENYAQIRALIIRNENDLKLADEKGADYEEKAKQVLTKAKLEEISLDKAEQLAIQALQLKNKAIEESQIFRAQISQQEEKLITAKNNIEIFEFNISKWEKELTTLRAKEKVTAASDFVNRQIANLDSNSTIDMLERLKSKLEDKESLAKAYEELANYQINRNIDDALKPEDSLTNELTNLKKQLGLD